MKNHRPPQSYHYYSAAMVAYHEGKMKRGDYYFLFYCASKGAINDWDSTAVYREPTARQKEQKELFRKLGLISREMANLQILRHDMNSDASKYILGIAYVVLRTEYENYQEQMKTISQRIPA